MSVDDIKRAIVDVVNGSNYQVNFIENTKDGLTIEVQRPTKFDYRKSIKTTIHDEDELGTFREALQEAV